MIEKSFKTSVQVRKFIYITDNNVLKRCIANKNELSKMIGNEVMTIVNHNQMNSQGCQINNVLLVIHVDSRSAHYQQFFIPYNPIILTCNLFLQESCQTNMRVTIIAVNGVDALTASKPPPFPFSFDFKKIIHYVFLLGGIP